MKKKMVKGILIDSEARTVKIVELEGNNIDQMHELIKCECFTCVDFNNRGVETVYVDDNGLLNDPKCFFAVPGYPQWIAGNGLILGTNAEGESISTKLTVEQVESLVRFGAID